MSLDNTADSGLTGKQGDSSILALFQSFPEPVFIISPEGTLFDANKVFFSRFTGNQKSYGINIFDLLTPKLAAERLKIVQEAVLTARPLTFDDDVDGRLLRNTIYPYKSPEGNVDRLLIIAQDITDIGQLLKKEQFFNKQIINAVPGSICILDANGNIVTWNEQMRDKILGLSEKEMAEALVIDAIHPDDQGRFAETMQDIMNKGKEVIGEFRIVPRGESDFRWNLITGKKIVIDGAPFLVGVGIDITERKRTEKSLHNSEARFRKIFENNTAIIILLDSGSGNIIDANQSAADFYGWSVDELKQMNMTQINPMTPSDFIKSNQEISNLEIIKAAGNAKLSFCHLTKNNGIHDVEVAITTIDDGTKDLLYVIVTDVSHQKRYEQINALGFRILNMADTHSIEELLTATSDEAARLTGSSFWLVFFCR